MRIRRIDFHRTKYGPELLVDVAWIHDMPAFIVDAPHALAFYDITLVHRGRGTFTLDGRPHAVKPGVVLFSAPGQIREWRVERLDGLCLFFPATFVEEFLNDPLFLDRLPFFGDPAGASVALGPRGAGSLRRSLERMRRELSRLDRDSVHLLRARLYETLVTLARSYASRRGVAPERAAHPVVARYRTLVDKHAAREHRVAWYAAALGVTPGHLNVLCKASLGTSAKRYVEDVLATRARRALLYTGDSAARIGSALGFEDPSYFSRFMRRVAGRAPSSFRD